MMKIYSSPRFILPLLAMLAASSALARPIKIPPPELVDALQLTTLWNTVVTWLTTAL